MEWLITYVAQVRFEIRMRVQVRVRDLAIFEKDGYKCGIRQFLKKMGADAAGFGD